VRLKPEVVDPVPALLPKESWLRQITPW
jgi:hypothetical protein